MNRLLTPREAINLLTVEEVNKFGTSEYSILLSEIMRRTVIAQDLKTQHAIGDEIESQWHRGEKVALEPLISNLRKGMFFND